MILSTLLDILLVLRLKLDSHFDCVPFNKQFHHQQIGATFDEEFN